VILLDVHSSPSFALGLPSLTGHLLSLAERFLQSREKLRPKFGEEHSCAPAERVGGHAIAPAPLVAR
jgi:hypothetical protein